MGQGGTYAIGKTAPEAGRAASDFDREIGKLTPVT
jgi:hypothetical protein